MIPLVWVGGHGWAKKREREGRVLLLRNIMDCRGGGGGGDDDARGTNLIPDTQACSLGYFIWVNSGSTIRNQSKPVGQTVGT